MLFDIDEHYSFSLESLKKYTFTKSDEKIFGYDNNGKIIKKSDIEEAIINKKISKIFPRQYVYFADITLGYIQECPDGTWLAHSSYHIDSPLDGVEVFGFVNEFYAVRYLHSVLEAVFTEDVEVPPKLDW